MVKICVKELLAKEGQTPAWLMAHLDCTYAYAKRLAENHIYHIDLATVDQLCEIFHCTPYDLFRKE